MSAVDLSKTIENLKKCYVGKKDGVHQLDRSKMNDLFFDIALNRVNSAIKSGQITEEEFLNKVSEGYVEKKGC